MNRSSNHQSATLAAPRPNQQQSVDARLAYLAERWNPLIGTKPRRELLEDVNSLVSDEVQRVQRFLTMRPSDSERVHNLAELITRKSAFAAIRAKKDFLAYVELYIVALLRTSRYVRHGKSRL